MDASQNVPVSIFSPTSAGSWGNNIAIGSKRYGSDTGTTTRFLYLVVDLSDLSVVAEVADTSNDTVPAAIQAYAGQARYFLLFVAIGQITGNMPQGALSTFLRQTGSGPVLASMEQMIASLGTGSISGFSYALGASLDEQDLPGFEAGSFNDTSFLTFAFTPITNGGTTTYAPISV